MALKKSSTSIASFIISLSCFTAIASPSPYSNFLVFGDSMSDAGQFPDLKGPSGSTLRFTNRTGPTYQAGSGEYFSSNMTQLLGTELGFSPDQLAASTSPTRASRGLPDGNNWAVGGYRTDQILDSILIESKLTTDNGKGPSLRSRPGYLPANDFRADPDALYYLAGGGNDFLQGLVLNEPQANAAAGRLADSVRALQQAGAQYFVVWMLPDIGATPSLALSNTGLRALSTKLSDVFNQELLRQLNTIDAQIIPFNGRLLLQEVIGNPARFGFASDVELSRTCFSDPVCTGGSPYSIQGASPDPSKLLFNDKVHVTEEMQQIAADSIYSILSAPWELTLLPEMAQGSLRTHQNELRNQWRSDFEDWQKIGQWRAIVASGSQGLDIDTQPGAVSANSSGYYLTLGTSYRLNEAWRIGVASGLYRQTLEAGTNDSKYRLDSYLGSAFAQYQQKRWWGDVALTTGRLNYDNLKRKFTQGINEELEKGHTSGDLWAISGRVGYDITQPGSQWHLSPFLSANYTLVEVDSYSEKEARSTSLAFGDQTRTSRRLGLGLQGKYKITPNTHFFGEIAREREYNNDTQKVTMSLNSLPGHDFTLPGYTPDSNLNHLSLGIIHKLTKELSLQANYFSDQKDKSLQQGLNIGAALDL